MSNLLELSEQLVKALKEQKLFITTVESCTGGGVANCITNISGASEVMFDSSITYSNEAKIALGVPKKIIEEFTVYSMETAIAMARAGIQYSSKADIGVGVTGSLSRLDPTNASSTLGIVYIAVVSGDIVLRERFEILDASERWEDKDKVIKKTLEMIIEIVSD
ncbi:CinA family protein [Moritella sp. F3]|uniref:CinA family protein n=1 Tax=Moritella sp. F3 TaxID=2718882 RepID=UPI0018E1BFC7|nr:CinA family protein [Moritella sp. F3]GIC75631.1 hypothetical protein FMO001_03580 [Moritella sp. F1]GIC80776.1 hypothetical protein FMO003_10570 [Moritella sp. F3]